MLSTGAGGDTSSNKHSSVLQETDIITGDEDKETKGKIAPIAPFVHPTAFTENCPCGVSSLAGERDSMQRPHRQAVTKHAHAANEKLRGS